MGRGGDENLQIVGLGMATLDVLIRLHDMPSWDRGTPISGFRLDGGGPVGTAMVAAARLGARVGFVGTAGNDQAAELKMRSLIESGVDLSRMVYRAASEDQIALVYVHVETGERVFAGVSPAQRMPLRAVELDREYITAAEYLHLDGFHPEAALQAASWARQAGQTVVLDGHKTSGPVHEHLRALVQYVDVLIGGSGFLQGLTGVADTCQAGAAALDMGPKVIVQTEGEDGSYTVAAEGHFHVPAFSVDVVDTTGAGDVFHGAYIVGLLHGWDLEQIAWFSTAVAALKCTQLGGRVGIPCFGAVLEFLHQRGIHLEQ
jgi:sulfofructose kinase